jgi:predicted  nucleic acid-binding Zn-ribbon protein
MNLGAESTIASIGAVMAGLAGIAALIESVRKWVVRNSETQAATLEKVQEITSTLNHLDEPIGQHPTVGQMISRIDGRVDRVESKIDGLHTDVRALSNAMLAHITDEARRTQQLEDKVQQLDRRKWEADGGQGITD